MGDPDREIGAAWQASAANDGVILVCFRGRNRSKIPPWGLHMGRLGSCWLSVFGGLGVREWGRWAGRAVITLPVWLPSGSLGQRQRVLRASSCDGDG